MTRNLNPVEVVALLAVIGEVHLRGEPLPEDHRRLAKRCQTTTPAMTKAIEVLISEGLIVRKPGGLWSDYAGAEIAYREERSQVASENVKKRWQKTQRNQGSANTDVAKSLRVQEEEEGIDIDRSPSRRRATSDGVGDIWASPMSPSSTADDLRPFAPVDDDEEELGTQTLDELQNLLDEEDPDHVPF